MEPARRKPWVHGLLLLAAAIAAYANSFDVPFLFDDKSAIEDSPYIRSLWPLDRAMSALPQSTGAGRPILNLSLAINYHFGGLRVWGYHAVNLGIHIAVGWVLYGLIRRTLQLPSMRGRFGQASHDLAFAAALLWLVHPIQTESVTYIVQRAESIAALFYTLTIYAALRGSTGGGRGWLWVAILSSSLGMASKETLATAPLMVLFHDRFFNAGSFRAAFERRGKFYGGLAATWIILATIMATGPRSDTAGFGENLYSPWDYALGQFGVVLHYLKLIVYPARLCLDYAWPLPESIGDVAGAMAIILALLAASAWGFARRAAWAYCACWFFIILSPTSTIVPIADLAFEHRVYLPMAGLTTLLVCGVYGLVRRSRPSTDARSGESSPLSTASSLPLNLAAWAVVLSTAGVLGWRTHARNETYRSELSIWSDTVEQRRENSRAVYNLAWAQFKRGDVEAAERGLRRAIEINPEYAAPRGVLAVLLSNAGRHEEGLVEAWRAAELEPKVAENLYNVGLILSRVGRDEEAAGAYRRAIELQPDYAGAYYNLGNIEIRAKRWPEAAAYFTRAIELDPLAIGARFNLAGIMAQSGRRDDANRLMAEALAIAREQAARARGEERLREALELQEKVVQIRPQDPGERLQLARDLADVGRSADAVAQCEEAIRLGAGDEARALRRAIESGT